MTALVGSEVSRNVSAVGGVGAFCRRTAAAQPQQAAGEDVADLTEVGWEVGVGGVAAHPL
jgi:hypothetical protein